MKIGIRIPSHTSEDLGYADAARLCDYSQQAEESGFHSIWAIEHLLVAPPIYRVSWLDPVSVLSFVAGCTRKVILGTGIIVLPLRNPVLLAKEVASLMMLSGGRLILGVAPGWYRPEYEAVGVSPRERGRRTDESLEILRLLLTESSASYEGSFFRFKDVTIDPIPSECPPIWVAGGSATDPSSGEATIPESVLQRIALSDGWLAGSSGRPEEGMVSDWNAIRVRAEALGRDPSELVFAHTQFLHLVESPDRNAVIHEQEMQFRTMMGDRPPDELRSDYLFGTIDEIRNRLQRLRDAGVQCLVLTPVSRDPKQLDLITRHLLPIAAA